MLYDFGPRLLKLRKDKMILSISFFAFVTFLWRESFSADKMSSVRS